MTGGDATENDDFQIGKQRLQGTIFFRVQIPALKL